MDDREKVINAESVNNDIDATLDQISKELKENEALILDVGNNYFNQTDVIYDKLVTMGYHVKKSFKNGRNQVIIANKGN